MPINEIIKSTSAFGVLITAIGFVITSSMNHKSTIDAQSKNQYMYHKNEVIKEAITMYQIAFYDDKLTMEEYTDLSDHALKIAVWSNAEVYGAYIQFIKNLDCSISFVNKSQNCSRYTYQYFQDFMEFLKYARIGFSNNNEDELDSLNKSLLENDLKMHNLNSHYKSNNKINNSMKKMLKEIKIDNNE